MVSNGHAYFLLSHRAKSIINITHVCLIFLVTLSPCLYYNNKILFVTQSIIISRSTFDHQISLLAQQQKSDSLWMLMHDSPVQMFLHHCGDGPRYCLLLSAQTLVQTHPQFFLQEVNNEFSSAHLFIVILNPRHLALIRETSIKVILPWRKNVGEKSENTISFKFIIKIVNLVLILQHIKYLNMDKYNPAKY